MIQHCGSILFYRVREESRNPTSLHVSSRNHEPQAHQPRSTPVMLYLLLNLSTFESRKPTPFINCLSFLLYLYRSEILFKSKLGGREQIFNEAFLSNS